MPLGVDIYLPQIKLAVEYQGEQHVRPIPSWGGKGNHEKIMARDKEKKEKLQQKGVYLIEINHLWDGSRSYIEGIFSGHSNFFHAITVPNETISFKAENFLNLDITWKEYYLKLEQHKNKYGNFDVHRNEPHNKKLINWVNAQRRLYHENRLTEFRKNQLEKLGISWDLYKKKEDWYKFYKELVDYKEKFGHCNVPQRDKIYTKLPSWINHQRNRYKNNSGEEDEEWKERIRLLNEIGFVWNIKKDRWQFLKEEIIQFVKINEHGRIPSDYQNNKDLGKRWAFNLRRQKVRGKLSQEKIEELVKLGFSWDPEEDEWLAYYNALVRYKEENGNCRIKHGYIFLEGSKRRRLDSWVARHLIKFENEELTHARQRLLLKIGLLKSS